MTCIAALIDDKGQVWVGGDALGTDPDSLDARVGTESKVWSTGNLVFGGCGSFRIMQLLRWHMDVPEIRPDEEPLAFISGALVDAMRASLSEGGALTTWDETATEELYESGFLVACEGRLFEIYSDFGVGEYVEKYAAIGCGAPFALGALYTTAYLTPKKRIRSALKAAEKFSAGVKGPFTIQKI
jgi:hypothetical protein